MRERLYEAKVVESRAAAEAAEGARAARQWNRTGVLHARYAVYEKALSAFRLALELDGSYQSPRINLANVHILTGRAAEALPVLQEGAAERPSVRILLALAQVYSELDRPQEAQETLDRLAERAPELAARYGYLAQVPQDSADEARASAAAAGPQVLWAAGE
jgi:predicted Zn-dependent protease